MQSIQSDYKELLIKLLPILKSYHALEALDEINIFWIRHIDIVQLYLHTFFPSSDSYVFTASTYMDFEDKEHLPFLLMGNKHILDDPLSKYSEMCSKIPDGKNSDLLYSQIEMTAEDNLKILKNTNNHILILPLRLISQSNDNKRLFDIGEKTFISLFSGINSLGDYFEKCTSIEDILCYFRKNIEKLVLFSEDDDLSLNFEERFRVAVSKTEYVVDTDKSDSYNFFILVFGCMQQAIDVIMSCLEYKCIPYIRSPLTLHYISLLSERMTDIEHIVTLRYKMSVAFVVYQLSNKEQLNKVNLDIFLKKNQEYNFNQKLFDKLEQQGINENNFLQNSITKLVIDELQQFYDYIDVD